MIQIQNVTKKYGETVIFEKASFSFPDKGLVCVFGPSGCGKSTLLTVIAGFDSLYDGEILVHGSSISKMNEEELCAYRRNQIGFVFQDYHLLSGYTALENVMLAPGARIEKAKELLQKMGLSEKMEQKSETLSGGQKQRVAIARALVNAPAVILADEPCGALDRKNANEIMELLQSLAEDRLVIVITHDKKCAEYADQIVTIQDRKFISEKLIEDEEEIVKLEEKEVPKSSLWKRAMKNFKIHLPRYIAIALAISIGVLCFTISLSSGNIMKQSIKEFEKKNTAYHNGYVKAEGNEEQLLSLLKKDVRLENIYTQYVLRDVSVEIEGENQVTLEEKYPMAKTKEKMSYGVMPRRGEDEIALNPSLAAKFDKNIQNLIGKAVELKYNGKVYSVTVSGIFNATFDDYYVSSDIEQEMYEGITGDVYSVSYDVVRFEEIVKVSDNLKEKNINSQDASAEVAAFLNTFHNLNRLFLTVSVLILTIGIFISIVLLVKQQNTRYREIGLLSALGYTKGGIRKILLYENIGLSMLTVFCSGILMTLFSFAFSVGQMIVILFISAGLILMIGFVSSSRLVKIEPIKALKK